MNQQKTSNNYLVFIFIFTVSLLLLIILLAFSKTKPPIHEFQKYHEIIDTHEKFLKNQYDPLLTHAEFFSNEAYKELQNQNAKFFIYRDYSETKRMILIAISLLEEASEDVRKDTIGGKTTYPTLDNILKKPPKKIK